MSLLVFCAAAAQWPGRGLTSGYRYGVGGGEAWEEKAMFPQSDVTEETNAGNKGHI